MLPNGSQRRVYQRLTAQRLHSDTGHVTHLQFRAILVLIDWSIKFLSE